MTTLVEWFDNIGYLCAEQLDNHTNKHNYMNII